MPHVQNSICARFEMGLLIFRYDYLLSTRLCPFDFHKNHFAVVLAGVVVTVAVIRTSDARILAPKKIFSGTLHRELLDRTANFRIALEPVASFSGSRYGLFDLFFNSIISDEVIRA